MFANAAHYLLAGGRANDRPLYDDATTYRTLLRQVQQMAACVGAATPPGAFVLIEMKPTVERIAALMGVVAAGRVAVPLETDVRDEAAATIIGETHAAGRVGTFHRAASAIQDVPQISLAVAPRGPGAVRATTLRDPAVVLYTSGTTASPKGVVLSHGNIIANTISILVAVPLHRHDRVALVLPLTYSYGLSMLYTSLRAGAQLVAHPPLLLTGDFLGRADKSRTTVFAGVPHHYERLMTGSDFVAARLPSLRLVQCAGGKMPPAVIGELRERFPGARVAPMYGQTEATARLSILDAAHIDTRPTSVGRGIPGVRLRVLDEDMQPATPGQPGELYARGPNIMLGYLKADAATRSVLTPEGLRTRDLAVVDDEGFIELVGRTADFAKPRGVRVSLPQVESTAEALAAVEEAVALGVVDEAGREEVVLELRLSPGGSCETVLRDLRRALPPSHVPSQVVQVAEIPRTASGKKIRWRERAVAP
jgi:acyl-CoA synthetase (AMP-forming)/AMP-acid ligase II